MTIQNLGTNLTSDDQSEIDGSVTCCKKVFTKEYINFQLAMIALGFIVFAYPSVAVYTMYSEDNLDFSVVKKVSIITGSIGAGIIALPFLVELFRDCIYGCERRSDTVPLLKTAPSSSYGTSLDHEVRISIEEEIPGHQ